jgi:hypothetical protein
MMQLKSGNGTIFREATIMLSTVKLPFYVGAYEYESCLFNEDGSSEVVGSYTNMSEALEGHKTLTWEHGLS